MKKREFSKTLLIFDYVITGVLLALFFICQIINGVYTINTINDLINMGMDVSAISITPPFNLDIFGVLLGTWIVQLGVSSGAYYLMCKSDHRIQLPMKLINEIPDDIKDEVDMTTLITTVLTSSES